MSTTSTTTTNGANGVQKRGAQTVLKAGKEAGNKYGRTSAGDLKTDFTRWRLKDDRGVQTWHYLESEEEVKEWPQSTADKWYLGLDTEQPALPTPKTPLQCASNGLEYYSKLQQPPGNWACEYGGPMFLMPGLVVTWYVTETPIPEPWAIEIKNYLFARAHPEDGGWSLHIDGESSVFGTAMNYTVLRILGVEADDLRMIKARETLWKLGGALNGPHWTKFWLAVLNIIDWEAVNPTPPELWLLPDWTPIAPWRWWIHMRQVFLPMSYVYSQRWQYPLNSLTRSLREELLTEPYESVYWEGRRNTISVKDDYHSKTWILKLLFWLIVWIWTPFLRPLSMKKKAEEHVWWLICAEDHNTSYSNLGPVNAAMNTLVCYIRCGRDSTEFQEHLKTLPEFLWVKNEGMLMNGTNGVQVWDTAFTIQAAHDCGFTKIPKWRPMLTKALEFLEDQQIREEASNQALCYRHTRKGAWGFSNRKQGYTVSDCVSEGVKAVLTLQSHPECKGLYPKLLDDRRIFDAIDVLLTMQNASGGCASYEPQRGSELLEYLNAAEVFGRIMVEYDYPECTTAVVTALTHFQTYYPSYRSQVITTFKDRAIAYIRKAQRADGSWYGSWGICFCYAGWFALESLACAGESYENSERVRRACHFFLDRQMEDGGWGETYRACETGVWHNTEMSQVVHTAWVVIALLEARYPNKSPIQKAVKLLMSRQQKNGEWLQEAVEGVFNKSCVISYPNYKFIFPIKALGMYAKRYGDEELF